MPFPLLALLGGLGGVLSGGAKGSADQRHTEDDLAASRDRNAISLYNTQQGSADSRYGTQQRATTDALSAEDRGAVDRYGIKQRATTDALDATEKGALDRSKLGMDSASIRAKQSIRASLMKNGHGIKISGLPAGVASHMPTITGGLSLDSLDPITRQHGDALLNSALMAQLTGSDVPAATDFKGGVLDAPANTDFRSGVLTPPNSLTAPTLSQPSKSGVLEKTLGTSGLMASILAALAKQQQPPQMSGNTVPLGPHA